MTSALGNECLMRVSSPALFLGLILKKMFRHSASVMDPLGAQLAASINIDI